MRRLFTYRIALRLRALLGERRAFFLPLTALVATCTLAVLFGALFTFGRDGPVSNPTDFRAFYCAGRALARGENPYRYGPLQRCSAEQLAANGLRADDRHVLPVPLPPYAIVPFAAISFVPFRIATSAWLAASVLAVGSIILMLASAIRIRPIFVALAFVFSLGFASLVVAQLVPLALAGLVYAAWALHRGNVWGAALGAFVGAIEPHLAAPVWIALAMLAPSTRIPLASAAAILIAISLPLLALDIEYFRDVVAAHARSEIFNTSAQYSLSTWLVACGVSIRAALLFGSASYLAMCVAGIALGDALARRFAERAFVVITPLAAVLFGGPFIHGHQLAAALPFGLVLAKLDANRGRSAAVIVAVVALAIPWESIAAMPVLADREPSAYVARLPKVIARATHPRADDAAELAYTAFVDSYAPRLDRRDPLERFIWKVPDWVALATILLAGAFASRRPVNVAARSAES